MHDLKARTIRGGLARVCAQAAGFILKVGSFMILARLLNPRDFGLVGMVTAFSGVLGLFRDFGLSTAAVQRKSVTDEQMSTLFWINLFLGTAVGLILLTMAPAIAAFYHEPQLVAVAAVLALAFPCNAAGIQHATLLQREMRFTALAVINVVSSTVGVAIAIYGAKAGYGYWALVWMGVAPAIVTTIALWLITDWVPKLPRWGTEIRNLIHFGVGTTFTSLLVYAGYNADKIMIGRFWGTDAIGIYGRAFQLVGIPNENLTSAVGEVAFSALSRLQDDPVRFRRYFLKGLSLVLGVMVPIAVVCALFADDVVFVILGPKWKEAVMIVRLLAPTIVIFALFNPLGWLVFSLGLVRRGVQIGPVLAALMIAGYAVALPYGSTAVAFAFSTVLTLWVIPHIWFCVRGTMVSVRDVLGVLIRPFGSAVVAGGVAFGARVIFGHFFSPFPRLVLESAALFAAFFGVLLLAAGERSLYFDLLSGLWKPSSAASPNER